MNAQTIKNLLTVLLIMQVNWLFSQESDEVSFPVNDNTGKIEYQEVIEAEGKANKLFYRAVTWMNDHWENARGMIKKQDKVNGILEAHVRFDIKLKDEDGDFMKKAGRAVYVLKMEFKDGRFRYTINDLHLLRKSPFPLENWIDPDSSYYPDRKPEVLKFIKQEIEETIESMKEGMKKEEEIEDDDW
ncbi:MAG: DUF4468 domain-containing protein [Bacteroidales bacterium]